ncbi:MAG: DUF456 domain-containing protein [Alistipes sp.]|nr:DUF456 domain-containing protein [Alistipes sp.]
MDVFLSILAVLLGITGMIGSVVPVIPGVILSFAGLLCTFFCSTSQTAPATVWIWFAVTAVVSIVDYFLPAYLTKLFGGSRAAVIGATIGLIVGIFFTPVGMILGTFLGAVIGELLHNHDDIGRAIKAGAGSFLSFIVGSGIKLIAAIGMFFYICRDVFPSFAAWLGSLFS